MPGRSRRRRRKLSASKLPYGRSRTVSGTVRPVQRGTVTVKKGAKTVASRNVPLKAGSTYRFVYKPTKKGAYTVTASRPNGTTFRAGTSPVGRFRVY